jgi:hypothetical protein
MQKKVNVRVDQAWQKGSVAKIDYFRARRSRNLRANFTDQVALDQNFARRRDAPRFNIKYPGRV